jgi:hypothetical protein
MDEIGLLGRFRSVPAEFPAQGGENPFGKWILLAGSKTAHQGYRDDFRRNTGFDRLEYRPPAFA